MSACRKGSMPTDTRLNLTRQFVIGVRLVLLAPCSRSIACKWWTLVGLRSWPVVSSRSAVDRVRQARERERARIVMIGVGALLPLNKFDIVR